jgi:hypothetical protein
MDTYILHLDLHLLFVPPMNEYGRGVVMHRELELPFVPTSGLCVCGESLDECAGPIGFTLKNLTWDIDRRVFLAESWYNIHDDAIAHIPDTIRGLLDREWNLGSYQDSYEPELTTEAVDAAWDEEADDIVEVLHTLPRTQRSREFNRFFKALVRAMAENYDNSEVAYAMDSLGRFLSNEDLKFARPSLVDKWHDAQRQYNHMNNEQQLAWLAKVAKYPMIADTL